MASTDDHTRLLRALLTAFVELNELPHPRHTGRVLLAAAVAGKSCSDDAVARAASMPVDAVREVLQSMLDRCLHVPALLVAKTRLKPGSLIGQLTAVHDASRFVPHVACDRMKLSLGKFIASDVGQKRLNLIPGVVEAVELVTRFITVKAIAVTDVKIIACHAQSGGPGWGTRLPTVSEPRVGRDDGGA